MVGDNGTINADLYAYLKQQLIEAQITFIKVLQEENIEVITSFLDDWEKWCYKIEKKHPSLALRLSVAIKVFKVTFAFDVEEAQPYLPRGLILRDIWQPLIEAVNFAFHNGIGLPRLIGRTSLQIRDAFIKRSLN